MNEIDLDKFQRRNPNILLIQSNAKGMYYGVTKTDKNKILLIGNKWYTILTREQAKALAGEIEEIFDCFAGKENIPYGEEVDDAYKVRNKWWFDARDAICFSEKGERKRHNLMPSVR